MQICVKLSETVDKVQNEQKWVPEMNPSTPKKKKGFS